MSDSAIHIDYRNLVREFFRHIRIRNSIVAISTIKCRAKRKIETLMKIKQNFFYKIYMYIIITTRAYTFVELDFHQRTFLAKHETIGYVSVPEFPVVE